VADFAQNDAAGELNGMSSVAVRRPSLAELEAEAPAPGRGRNLDLVLDISVPVTVELGHTRMKIADLLSLHSGAVIELDRRAGEPVDLLVNGKLIGQGEVVVVEDSFGIRITAITDQAARLGSVS